MTLKTSSLLLLPLMIFALLFGGCGRENASGGAAGKGGAAAGGKGKSGGRKAFDVRTSPVETRRVTYEIQAVGSLMEENRFEIPAQVAGVAGNVKFSEGDAVTTGQELCRIDYERNQMEVTQAQSNVSEKEAALQRAFASVADVERETSTALSTARVNLELAQNEYKRRADRGANAFTSPEERDQFEAKFRQAQTTYRDAVNAAGTQVALAVAQSRESQAALETARAQLALVKDNFDRSIVKAPIAGVIQQRSVVEGQFVKQGDPVALMVQSNPLRLRFTVPESRASRLQKEMQLSFTVPAYANRTFQGTVYDIGAFADQETREVVCWARVSNNDARLKPGFFTHVELLVDSREEAVVVPLASVLPTETGMTAYVIEDGLAVRRAVKTGLQVTGDAIEVLDGLRPGEQLVVEGMTALQNGVPVRVLPAAGGEITIQDKVASATRAQDNSGTTQPMTGAIGG
jgi:RND family efflux transporter MFP subunit